MEPRFYEEFALGETFETRARTVTEADIVNFAGLSWDFNPLHTDEEYGKTTQFGHRIAHGMLVLSMSTGLSQSMGFLMGTVIAFLGLEWKFTGPVFAGDTIRMVQKVGFMRETSKPDRGIIRFDCEIANQHGKLVQTGSRTLMVRRRTAGGA